MRLAHVYCVLLLFPLFCAVSLGLCLNPSTVSTLDVTQYSGLWYQIAEDPFVANTSERNAVCSTAYYTVFANGTVGVLNKARLKTIDGVEESISGYARIPDKNFPGRLIVHLDGVPFPAPYWILKLGDVVNNQYRYAIVSDNTCASLFVLSRTNTLDADTEKEIKNYLTSVGFNVEKEYVPILQRGCTYTH
jgi:apolipoprotein D and lipocalin family protein